METELEDCVNKTYEKCVHAQTREYIESIAAPARAENEKQVLEQKLGWQATVT